MGLGSVLGFRLGVPFRASGSGFRFGLATAARALPGGGIITPAASCPPTVARGRSETRRKTTNARRVSAGVRDIDISLGLTVESQVRASGSYFFEAQHAFLALQELPLTAPMLASDELVIGQVFGAEQLLEQELPLTAPMLALSEQVAEQLLLHSPTAPMLALSEHEEWQHSFFSLQQADLALQQAVEHSLPTAPALTVELPVVAQPRRAHERKRAARPVTRIMEISLGSVN